MNAEYNETKIILLREKELSYLPFLRRGDKFKYIISNTRRAKLKDESMCKSSIEVSCLSNDSIATCLYKNEDQSSQVDINVILNVSDLNSGVYIEVAVPSSNYSLENLSCKLFSIRGLIKSVKGLDFLILEDSSSSSSSSSSNNQSQAKSMILILISFMKLSFKSLSLRPGAEIILHEVYPVYIWGRLIAFCAISRSYIEIIKFSSPKSIDVNINLSSRFKKKSVLYILWHYMLTIEINKYLPDTNRHLIESITVAIEKLIDISIFEPAVRSPLLEFVDKYFVSFLVIRSGLSFDKINKKFPQVDDIT